MTSKVTQLENSNNYLLNLEFDNNYINGNLIISIKNPFFHYIQV